MGAPELIAAATFLLIALLIAGPYYLFVVRAESVSQQMLRQRIRPAASAVRIAGASLLKDVRRLSAIGPLERVLGGSGRVAENLRGAIQQSGLPLTPGHLVLGSGCLALLAYVSVVTWVGPPWLAAIAGLSAGIVPYAIVRRLTTRRLRKFEEQFPEAVDLIARTLRAGHGFPTGLRLAADELPEPIASEFRLLHDQQNYGLPMSEALRSFAARNALIDARFFVTAVLTQREAGGNLAEVLDNLAAVIRERFKIKRQLRVVSAHGRMTGVVLTALPPSLAAFMLVRMPENFRVLLEDPLGMKMIVIAVLLQVLGAVLIHKITNVEY